jgi:hypothetical protein
MFIDNEYTIAYILCTDYPIQLKITSIPIDWPVYNTPILNKPQQSDVLAFVAQSIHNFNLNLMCSKVHWQLLPPWMPAILCLQQK